MIHYISKLAKKFCYKLFLTLPDKTAIQLQYFLKFGRFINFRDPVTLTEKINWRKLYQRDPRFTVFADKILAKTEVAKLIGQKHIIPTLWSGDCAEDIPFDSLTPPYIIKVNHSSGKHILVRAYEKIDREKIIKLMRIQSLRSHASRYREWGYMNINKKILIEPLLESSSGKLPEDYKFFVFHGHVLYIQIDHDRFNNHTQSFYDRSWNKLSMTWTYPDIGTAVSKPLHFEKMIEIAEKIGSLFDFARVDLYQLPSGVFFGEVTFYPSAGLVKIKPKIWDKILGAHWHLPITDKYSTCKCNYA